MFRYNIQVFIDFLAQLRRYYLDRERSPAFHSVILASVYDIKNLKLKIRADHEHQFNSPWNIAARFSMDMNFSAEQIAQMVQEYEDDRKVGMDVESVARCIYEYTSGYPYLVSAICRFLDEEIPGREGFERAGADEAVWSRVGVEEAVKMPIINSAGNYYLEAQTRDDRRTDVVVDYRGEQFIIEMKIWHGNEYNERGGRQLAEYLDYFRQKKGYMLSFNFNKKKEKGIRTILVGDKEIVEAVV